MDFEVVYPQNLIGFSPSRLHKLQYDFDSMEEGTKDGLRQVAYLKKVKCSRKMESLQSNNNSGDNGGSNGYTVAEAILLDEPSGFEDISTSASISFASIRDSPLQLSASSLWYLVTHPSKKSFSKSQANIDNIVPITNGISLDTCNFSCCPPEVNFQVFSFLPQSQILRCRLVCRTWKTQIDFFFAFTSVLTADKLKKQFLSRRRIPFEMSHYDIIEFTSHLKHKHLQCIPEPKSIRILKRISSKNFLKLIDCWRNIESLSMYLEPLTSIALFQKWSYYHPLEYFPKLRNLTIHLDRLHLARYKSFNPKQLRFNLDQILMNPYTNLTEFSFQMLNSGRHFACAFLAPILMFIGRQGETLRKVEVVFHTGYEFETMPSYSQEQHAPCYYVPLDDQIYVHGEVNLVKLLQVQLTHCCLALPAISGCTTRSGICNYFTRLLETQRYLRVMHLETQLGVDVNFVANLTRLNQNFLSDIEMSINLPVGDVFNLAIFFQCSQLKALRLKRVGFIDLPTHSSQLSNIEKLPTTLEKLALHRFYMSVLDLYMTLMDKPKLQCLCVCCCYIHATKNDEAIADGAMVKVLCHPELKFVCFSPIRRNTLNKIIFKLKTSDHLNILLQIHGWYWSMLSRELWLAKPRRLILHRGEEHCTRVWFKQYVFEKVKV